ncbi:MAG: ParA family protein [Leptolyngbya sp. SIO4C1]|nr:ParA family protein [Leptolyngbya sp. SIO4C1]
MVIDTKARPSPEDLEEISQNCDLLILPSTTRPMDLEVLIKTVQAIKELQAPYSVLLTMVPPTSTRITIEIKELLSESKIPVFDTVIQKYAFVEQLPLDGTLAKDAKDENAAKIWQQYMQVGQEILG